MFQWLSTIMSANVGSCASVSSGQVGDFVADPRESTAAVQLSTDWRTPAEACRRHDVTGKPGTLDEHLKAFTKTNTAGWVAVVLEKAGVVDLIRDRPAYIRLRRE
jgi:hypothetical protein